MDEENNSISIDLAIQTAVRFGIHEDDAKNGRCRVYSKFLTFSDAGIFIGQLKAYPVYNT